MTNRRHSGPPWSRILPRSACRRKYAPAASPSAPLSRRSVLRDYVSSAAALLAARLPRSCPACLGPARGGRSCLGLESEVHPKALLGAGLHGSGFSPRYTRKPDQDGRSCLGL